MNSVSKSIKDLRIKANMTQEELAERLHITRQTVSSWETGRGCPDVALLPELSNIFGADISSMVSGDVAESRPVSGSMKKTGFFVCPVCGNILTATGGGRISCCGRALPRLEPVKAGDDEKLKVERIESELFVTSGHEMTKEHYISFVAFVNGDSVFIRKLFPEWNMETRLPFRSHGMLVWYCTRHGLFYQYV